jgi:hypothetical protein
MTAVVLAAPGVVLAVATGIGLVMTVRDQPPMWPHRGVNLAEAAGVRDESEVVRLIEDGADPNATYPVRAGLIFSYAMNLTPLEAAVANEDPVMVKQLVAKGASLDAPLWTHLRCIAVGDRVPAALDEIRPSGAALTCEGVVRPWRDD